MNAVLPRGYHDPVRRLIFGCARLHAGAERKNSVDLIAAALDLGIRRFDVAPSYALGSAERMLADALGPARHEVSITTKVGIASRMPAGLLQALRDIAKPIVSYIPGLRDASYRALSAVGAQAKLDAQDTDALETSFASSLRQLRVDGVDTLLLHDPDPQANVEAVDSWMRGLREQAKLHHFGCGTVGGVSKLVRLGDTAQFHCGPVGARASTDALFQRVHGVARSIAPSFARRVAHDGLLRDRLRSVISLDPANRDDMAALAVSYVLQRSDRDVALAPKSVEGLTRLISTMRAIAARGSLEFAWSSFECADDVETESQ